MTIFPYELYENILSLSDDIDLWKSCSLVARELRPITQTLLFERISLECSLSKEPFADENLATKLEFMRNPTLFSHIHSQIRAVSIFIPDIQRNALEAKVGDFLVQLTALRSLALRDRALPWSDINISLRTILTQQVFRQLKVLYLRGLIGLPFLTILSSSHALRHLSISQFEAVHCSEDIVENPVMPQLHSLTVDTFAASDFQESFTLIRAVDLCATSLKSIILDKHAWGLDSAHCSLSSAESLLVRYAHTLTHLHIGPEIYGKAVALNLRQEDHLPFSMLKRLELLQFQIGHKNHSGTFVHFFSHGYPFFRWLAKELSGMQSQSSLSQLICDSEYTDNAIPSAEVYVWKDLDKLITKDGNFTHFHKFRLRLGGSLQKENAAILLERLKVALPRCAGKGYLRVESWKGQNEIVNSIVREHCY
ncbi:hypothetical protein DL96DRAFT_1607187 [Flagelloscypha sp. PMI_526]|nr:hypothetical protein DL96DRAFT_1607187 [Flagelloscypha sp. PMI_526]